MKRGLPIRAQSRPICQLCDYILQQPTCRRSFLSTSAIKTARVQRQPARQHGGLPTIRSRPFASSARALELEPEIEHPEDTAERTKSLNLRLKELEKHMRSIYDSPKVEPEEAALEALYGLTSIFKEARAIRAGLPLPSRVKLHQSSASAILMLNDRPATEKNTRNASTNARQEDTVSSLPSADQLSELALELVRHEKVFISPAFLSAYIDLQILLKRPRQIPEALHLYANKSIPILNSSPPKFKKRSPKSYKNAVPEAVATKALDAAIAAKDISLALRVIDETYTAPAWIRRKILTKVGIPGSAVLATPLGLYMIAQELSVYSGYLDPMFYKWYAFAGMMTYVFGTGTLGFVALTTYNHHFDRVVWQLGTPLFERWLREDERAALDRIAGAWGFKETWKRGDETGPEWEGLKKLCLLRAMILDKTDLMPGMNA
ncbi:hypothetical protein K491DRAFT_654690 [Lophiostoma macrostomum CBS 122681]|uniref:Uncharacterized protein n=1 Tax=Lophiostoma macrostomum CBS 122681 TaxID=1314788 RepID=A0A6A6TE18_9PLEO|nr:hypothetical protein K491DRAFT_654690 [Lophiostoma macrostomum CBS 122681]